MTESPFIERVLQDAQTTGDGSAVDLRCSTRETVVYVKWSAGVTAGAVTVETADAADYTGTWASLGVVNWTAASKQDVVQITGGLRAVRARISTTVVDGTVSVRLNSN